MSTGGRGRAMSEINVTPMVDVMLVLLIIFMVTAPLIQQGVSVDLPEARAPALTVKEDRVIMTITKDRRIYLGEDEIPHAALRDKLVGNLKLKRDKEIYLHADRALPYGFVVDIMAIVKEAGVETLGMVTDPLTPQGR
ncbi:MAG: ExbD/TolR family protein [Deltaproteobacteria bacterium]|nr:ExbD/TolR family protein [Deltaproteobacteria bacterium]